MKYKAYLKQSGEGCDYTIACGQKVIDLKSNGLVGAQNELFKIIKEEYIGESLLEYCEIYEINQTSVIDLNVWYASFRVEDMEKEQRKIEESELKELERLKKKYEK